MKPPIFTGNLRRFNVSIVLLLLCLFSAQSVAQNISGTINIYQKVLSISGLTLTLSSVTGLSPGDLVLVIQMKGAVIDESNSSSFGSVTNLENAGNYELARICAISGNTIQVSLLTRQYTPANLVQVVRVPEYTSPTIIGKIKPRSWDGNTGGVVAMVVSGTLTMNEDISADTSGFRGGFKEMVGGVGCTMDYYYSSANKFGGAPKGEGAAEFIVGKERGKGYQANGGGGGNNHNAGGGGGGNCGGGGIGGRSWNGAGCGANDNQNGIAGSSLGNPQTTGKIFLGGGGGSGQANEYLDNDGWAGGGIIVIAANSIVANSRKITSNSLTKTSVANYSDGAGGSGAGGTILIRCNNITGSATLEANGGMGNTVNWTGTPSGCVGPGGGGGGGGIWLSTASLPGNVSASVVGGVAGGRLPVTSCTTPSNYGAMAGSDGALMFNLSLNIPGTTGANVDAGPDVTICKWDSTVLTATGTSATEFRWIPKIGLSCDTCRTTVARPSVTTKYYVSSGCLGYDSVTVFVREFSVVTSGTMTLCQFGDSATVYVRGVNGTVVKAKWTPPVGIACDTCITTKVRPSKFVTYAVSATDSLGCTAAGVVIVYMADPVPVDAGPDQEFCTLKDSITLRATGTTIKSVKWTPSAGLGCDTCKVTKARPAGTTTYYLTARDASGCIGIDSVKLTVQKTSSLLSVGPHQNICFKNDSARLVLFGSATKLRWTPNQYLGCDTCPLTYAKPPTTRWYKVTATDVDGCTMEDSIRVSVLQISTADAKPDSVICASTAVSMRVDGDFTSVTWSPPTGIACPTCPVTFATPPKKSITYYVTTHNGNSTDCDAVDSVRIRYAPGLENQLPKKWTLCISEQVTFAITFGGNVKWTPKTFLDCDTCHTVVATPTASIKYIVTGDSLGCISRDTIDITVVSKALLSIRKDTSICRGDTVQLTATTNANQITWSPPTDLSCVDCLNPLAFPKTTTRYIAIAGTKSCVVRDSVTITVRNRPIVFVSPVDTLLCTNSSLQLAVTHDTPGSAILWSPPDFLNCTDCPNPITSTPTSKTYTVTVTGQNSCGVATDVRVRRGTPPDFRIRNADDTYCIGGKTQIQLEGDTSGSFAWTPTTGIGCTTCPNPLLMPQASTRYIVTETTAEGCQKADTITITVNPLPAVTVTADTTVCKGKSVSLSASGGTQYIWMPDDGSLSSITIANPIATPQKSTTYTVKVISPDNCEKDTTVTITVDVCSRKLTTQNQPVAPRLSCDSNYVNILISNPGDVPFSLDSIQSNPTNGGAHLDPRSQDSVNTFVLPFTMNPGDPARILRLHIVPDKIDSYWFAVTLFWGDSTQIDTVYGTGYSRLVEFRTPPDTSIYVGSVFRYPVSVTSPFLSELRIDTLIVHMLYDSSAIQFDITRAGNPERGSTLDNQWSVRYDATRSAIGHAVFNAFGPSTLKQNGELFIPYFRSFLTKNEPFHTDLLVELPRFTLPCADVATVKSSIVITGCALRIRQITLSSTAFGLVPVMPNPAISTMPMTIRYSIGFPCDVDIRLFDVSGREVAHVVHGEHSAGTYEALLDPTQFASGMYYCTMSAAGNTFNTVVNIGK